ncbi:efflux RND transporter periplasmic adaptor subunit [Aquaspirillum soli]
MLSSVRTRLTSTLLAITIATVLSACSGGDSQPKSGGMPPPEVTVTTVKAADVPRVFEYVGQVAGYRDVEVRARVGGILQKRLYTEGKAVKQGDALFLIDPEQLTAAVDQAKGQLAVEQARLTRAKQEHDRVLPLFAENAVSQKDRDDAVTALESAQASVAAARAKLREADINRSYSRVTAPISGMTSKEVVSEGSLLSPNSLLTVISQTDPIYVNFSMADNDALRFRKLIQEGVLVAPEGGKFDIELRLADGSQYQRIGRMNFTDNIIDPTTGTLRARAEFANPEAELLPGQFVRVFMKGAIQKNAILIPQRAVLSTAQGTIVFIVNEQGKAEPRPIQVGEEIERNFVVLSGLKGGERLIVDGAMKSRPGQPVKPVELAAAPATSASPAKQP